MEISYQGIYNGIYSEYAGREKIKSNGRKQMKKKKKKKKEEENRY